MLSRASRLARMVIAPIARALSSTRWKEYNELRYWERRQEVEGVLANSHYRYFYTAHFGLDDSDYREKVVLDIGCGPRGSLEWASMASRRIGLDPLAKEYVRLGADAHKMEYVEAPSEAMPMEDGTCDVVCSFNSLDHVEEVERTVSEIKRVTRPGGLFLLLVEVNHPPTDCEPHRLTPSMLTESMEPEFRLQTLRVYRPVGDGMYNSILADDEVFHPERTKERGYMSARFVRVASD